MLTEHLPDLLSTDSVNTHSRPDMSIHLTVVIPDSTTVEADLLQGVIRKVLQRMQECHVVPVSGAVFSTILAMLNRARCLDPALMLVTSIMRGGFTKIFWQQFFRFFYISYELLFLPSKMFIQILRYPQMCYALCYNPQSPTTISVPPLRSTRVCWSLLLCRLAQTVWMHTYWSWSIMYAYISALDINVIH